MSRSTVIKNENVCKL